MDVVPKQDEIIVLAFLAHIEWRWGGRRRSPEKSPMRRAPAEACSAAAQEKSRRRGLVRCCREQDLDTNGAEAAVARWACPLPACRRCAGITEEAPPAALGVDDMEKAGSMGELNQTPRAGVAWPMKEERVSA